ncbi:MAG: DNA mismatch repair endonuclease MutL, partial [Sphingomonas sp.]
MSIRRLPEHLVNRIAAGEVVERPASALKELTENAIDAGATRIAIRLAAGGTELVEVVDDGCGMSPPEMALALERHATSKLPDDAIDQVTTLGFRGEALPSIASVARMTLESRVRGAEGWARVVDNGVVEREGPAALPPGTRVRVEQLFERVPARRKFLRSARSEYAACMDVVKRLAMARPDIAFSVEHDGRRALQVQGGETRPERVAALTDRALFDNSVAIDFEREGLVLGGVAGLPTFNRGVADHQYLFVNGRPVKDRLLVGAVRGAYAEMLARDRHPVVALFLDVPADAVDVNVHPAKTEVRFRDPALARGLIVSGLRRALDEAGHRSVQRPDAGALAMWTSERHPGESRDPESQATPFLALGPGLRRDDGVGYGVTTVHDRRATFLTPQPMGRAEPATEAVPSTTQHPLGVARGQVAKTYIVAKAEDGLVLVDQHAAHERLVLERMRRAMQGGGVASQALLLPEVVELDEPACDRLESRAEELAAFGLELERFGPRAMLVRATPAALGSGDVHGLVTDLADELASFDEALSLKERLDHVASTMACHGSVRAGRVLSVA